MNVPFKGQFKISQRYKGTAHDGFDMVGLADKNIYSPINGWVEYAGWENSANHKQGFGQYVKIVMAGSNDRYYFGHLSKISVKKGDIIKRGQKIGEEGSTGKSTGSHLHYCVREQGLKSKCKDISLITGVTNKEGSYQAPKDRWVRDAYGWWYCYAHGGYPKECWMLLDAWYYFDKNGYALQNTTLDYKGKEYVFGDDCRCVNP